MITGCGAALDLQVEYEKLSPFTNFVALCIIIYLQSAVCVLIVLIQCTSIDARA
jgi:hypothetical protein